MSEFIGKTVRELKDICRQLNISQKGSKSDLIDRIHSKRNVLNKPVKTEAFSSSWKEKLRHTRNPGERFEIGANNHDLVSSLLGMPPSTNADSDFIRLGNLAEATSQESKEQLVQCYIDPKIMINKKVCLWCSRKRECDYQEHSLRENFLTYNIYSKATDNNKTQGAEDSEQLKVWIKDKKHMISYDGEAMFVFNNPNDPFKPYFGRSRNRELNFLPCEMVHLAETPNSPNSWSHLFFSSTLNRTLALFEALFIDSLYSIYATVRVDGFPKFVDVAAMVSVGGEISRFWTDITKGKIFNFSDQPSPEYEKLQAVWILCKKTQDFYENGLLEPSTEVFASGSSDDTFQEGLHRFCNEVDKALLIKHKADSLFMERRFDAIVLTPSKDDYIPPLNGKLRVVRKSILNGLNRSWVLIDEDYSEIEHFDMNSQPPPVFDSTQKCNLDEAIRILNKQTTHKANFFFHHFETRTKYSEVNSSLSSNKTNVLVYDYAQLNAAYSSAFAIKNQKVFGNDEDFIGKRQDFERFMYRFFLYKGDGRKLSIGDEPKFVYALNLPSRRKLTSLERLRLLSKEFSDLIHYKKVEKEENGNYFQIDTLCLKGTFTKVHLEKNRNTFEMEIKLQRRALYDNISNIEKEPWTLTKLRGKDHMGPQPIREGFISSLVKQSDHGHGSNITRGIYLSSGLTNLIVRMNHDVSKSFHRWIGAHINTYCSPGVVCLALEEELKDHITSVGPFEFLKINIQCGFDDDIAFTLCSWTPPMASKETSNIAISTGLGS